MKAEICRICRHELVWADSIKRGECTACWESQFRLLPGETVTQHRARIARASGNKVKEAT